MWDSREREQLYRIFFDDDETERVIERALDLGREYLGVSLGFVTKIERGEQEIRHVTGEHDAIKPGERCPLDEAYCRRTIRIDGPLAVQDASASQAIGDRAQRRFGLGAYIGAKIVVAEAPYGTVCFASASTRDAEFTEPEETFVEILARLIGQRLERERFETELRARSRRLEQERDRFKTIADTTFDLLFRLDLSGEFTYVSSASEQMLAYSPEEIVGRHLTEFIAESSVEQAVTAYETVAQGRDIEAVELETIRADGETVTLEVNGTPDVEKGTVVGVHGVGRDVTARKEVETELQIKNQAIDEAQIGVTVVDAQQSDDPLTYVNQGFEQITGYDEADMLGRNCRFLQGEQTEQSAVDTLREHIAAAEPVTVELLNYRKDGTPFWNRVRINPVRSDGGDVTHFLGIQNDITEQKRSEQLVSVLNRVLRHNLRNDMGLIRGLGQELEDDGPAEAAAQGKVIRAKADKLIDIAEKARELEKVANRAAVPSRVDPAPLLAELAATYRQRYPAVTLETQIRSERSVCVGEEIRKAVSELVENAVKHTGSSAPRVVVAVEDDGERVELSVVDNGPGIDEMEAAVISKGEEHALRHGSGLGLWLVNWIVTRYGGSFQIQAEAAGGTRATIRLPAIDADQSVAAAAKRPTTLFS